MKISVLIPAYRAAATVARALASVRAQSHTDWELIVVEDGSDDGTESLVLAAGDTGCQAVSYVNLGTNQGVAATRNRLLQLATGEACAFLDADDVWAPDHLRNGARQLGTGAGLVVTGVRTFDLATDRTLGEVIPPARLATHPVGTLFASSAIVTSSSVFLSRRAWQRTGEFDATLRVGEDRDFWLRAVLNGVTLRIEPAVTCHYAKHAGSTMAGTLLVASEATRFYLKHSILRDVPLPQRRRLLARSLRDEARLRRASDARTSLRLLWRAWRLTPADVGLLPHLAYSGIRALGQIRPAAARTPAPAPRHLLVTDRLGGQCGYSGIHQLARFMQREPSVRLLATPDTQLRRLVGKAWSLLHRGPVRNQSQTFIEMKVGLTAAPQTAVHFLVGEDHEPYLRGPRGPQRVIATMHMPSSVRPAPPPLTGRVDTLILLTSREEEYFTGAWGARRTVVIPHGVDTDFFHPTTGPDPTRTSILVVGRFLRDFPLTAATVVRLAARHPDWHFDFVVPAAAWHGPDLAAVRQLPGAHWHDRISDEALRALYQGATCQLAPFLDCTANNAVVESLACGLPIVTTDRGGVRDYGGGRFYPLAKPTATALADLCEQYAEHPDWQAAVAATGRIFAVEELAWPVIARRHVELYAEVARHRLPS